MTEPEQSVIAVLERCERAQLRESREAMPRIFSARCLLVIRRLALRAFFIER